MSILTGTVLIVGLALVLLEIGARIPAKHRDLSTPGLHSLLELLYVRGLDGGVLNITRRNDRRTLVQVRKIIDAPDSVRLEVRLPQDDTSPSQRASGKLIAPSLGEMIHATDTDARKAGAFVIDAGDSVPRTLVLVEDLLIRYWQVNPSEDCVAWIERAHGNVRAHPGFTKAPDRVV